MALIHRCDICGDVTTNIHCEINMQHYTWSKHWELCKDCEDELRNYLYEKVNNHKEVG